MKTPKISVIIPIHNEVTYLSECMDSVLSQISDIEVLCVDNCSSDGSAEIIKDYAKQDDRVKYFSCSSIGAGMARNTGLDFARGEYIAFLDADDKYPNVNTLSMLYETAKCHNALVCGGSFSELHGEKLKTEFSGNFSGYNFEKAGYVWFKDYQFDYGFHRFIYKKNLLDDNTIRFPNLLRFQDPPFMAKAFTFAEKFYAVPEVTYLYRYNSDKVKWTKDKVYDLVCGIDHELSFAKEHRFAKLYFLNFSRLNFDYYAVLKGAISRDSFGLIKKLMEIERSLDLNLLKEGGFDRNEEKAQLIVLSDTLFFDSDEYAKRSISYKIGRIITWLPRKIRDLIRR